MQTMQTMQPGEFYEVRDIHGRWMETYELIQCVGRAGTNFWCWLVRPSGLFTTERTQLLPVQPKEAQ